MWGTSDSDSDSDPRTDEHDDESPPPLTGLALAEHYFGPLLSPIAATPALWTAYTKHRRSANATFKSIVGHRNHSISSAVAAIEDELGVDHRTLQDCISLLWRDVVSDDSNKPRNADILARIYSPAAPKYIDVHIKYYCHSWLFGIEWYYSIGYKIYDHFTLFPTTYRDPTTNGPLSNWHTRGGWKPICWGSFDDLDGSYDRRRHCFEVGRVELQPAAVSDIYMSLFGPIIRPASNDTLAVLAYRQRLVAAVRLLFATVGISYEIACADNEIDRAPHDYMLEGLSDRWVARGIRDACGFHLRRDTRAECRGRRERGDDESGVPDQSGLQYDGYQYVP